MCAIRKIALFGLCLVPVFGLVLSGKSLAQQDSIWPVERPEIETPSTSDTETEAQVEADAETWVEPVTVLPDAQPGPSYEDDVSDFDAIDRPLNKPLDLPLADAAEGDATIHAAPPEVDEFGATLLAHPSLLSSQQRVCQAKYEVLQNRAGYYPNVRFSLSGGNKLIDQTTRADEFGGTNSPEYDGKGVNATVTLSQSLYDWGRLSSIVEGSEQGYHIAQLERRLTLEEQLRIFFNAAFSYRLENELARIFIAAGDEIADGVAAMQARFKAGAARLTDVRQAQIIGLEMEARLSQAERQRSIHIDNIKSRFGLGPHQVDDIIDYFLRARPHIPEIVPAHDTLQTRLIQRNIARVKSEYQRLRAESRPSFTGVLTGRAWDIGQKNRCNSPVPSGHADAGTRSAGTRDDTRYYYRDQNCSTHELTGSIEFSMPLFDGGANKAQRGGINAQRIGLESNLEAYQRNHRAQSAQLRDSLLLRVRQTSEIEQRLKQLGERLDSVRLLQRQTRSDPLALITIQQRYAERKGELVNIRIQANVTRVELLALAAGLSKVMKISLGEIGC